MSTLRIRVDKTLDSDGGPPPRVFARIQQLDSRGRTVAASLEHVLVPISADPRVVQSVNLELGAYAIEVRLPSGELIADCVQLPENGVLDVVLVAEAPSHEWLAWQHLVGNVSVAKGVSHAPSLGVEIKESEEVAIRRKSLQRLRERHGDDYQIPGMEPFEIEAPNYQIEGGSGSRRGEPGGAGRELVLRQPGLRERLASAIERVGISITAGVIGPLRAEPDAPWDPQEPSVIEVGRALHWLSPGAGQLTDELIRINPWDSLVDVRGSTMQVVDALNAGRRKQVITPSASDEASAVFRVPKPLVAWSSFSSAERNFAAVHRRQGVELISLPTPWIDPFTGSDVPVEIGVQRPRYEAEFASSVTVRDQQLAVLLGFLSSGALPAARRLAETSSDMLYVKNANPLGAAAGGYALVSSAVDSTYQPWHTWIQNLMERFEDVPDGAIQYGTMRLRLRSSALDLTEAATAFKLAYHRGLPFFGLGMRWLLEGLERVGVQDEEASAMAKSVQRLTSRLHPRSPFTILRLGRR